MIPMKIVMRNGNIRSFSIKSDTCTCERDVRVFN